jgi:enamine deaminase RidA (YjgF/YER057c/UK114 family)
MSAIRRHAEAAAIPPRAEGRPPIAGARRIGDLVITSGQTAHVDGVNVAHGRVGDEVDLETARRAAWQCARNVVAAIAAVADLDEVTEIPRLTVYVASAPSFTDQHLVADAATAYLHEVFGAEIGVHTRAALGVAALPTGSPVEAEAVVRLAARAR